MDTALKLNDGSRFFSFSNRLFFSVVALFVLSVGFFIIYQYQREKAFKVELLDLKLQDYNERLHLEIADSETSAWPQRIDNYLKEHVDQALRVTLILPNGKVIYDNSYFTPIGSVSSDEKEIGNHLTRPEVVQALHQGKGCDIRRTSKTTGTAYFYSATAYPQVIIRSALPYNLNLVRTLAADYHYLWFALLLTLVVLFAFYKLTRRLGRAINQLREFAQRADRNEPINTEMQKDFPHNELGDISQHIIQIYKRLVDTKEALYIEREKLITHLQTAREGLGVFTSNKKEILVNNLFTQYFNLISDHNLERAEEIFRVKEFAPINDFINKADRRSQVKEERRMSNSINKNGRIFIVECIIFQDLSFEISVNDITQEEEQSRLKRQLTQNIAHELKTPVSSIQGYLETIVSTDNLPKEKLDSFIERCYAQSNRLSRLLRDISTLTRMDEAANMIEMERVDISLLVANMINEVALELEEKHISVINALKPKIQVQGDYSLLYSIFRNLMDNAIAYAGTGIRITLQCFREDEEYYYFSFADTGVGVAPEHLNRIFERFYRVDKGRSRKLGGTGLGLAIVKNAVLIHGGTIQAKNTLGGGLEFLFTLAKQP